MIDRRTVSARIPSVARVEAHRVAVRLTGELGDLVAPREVVAAALRRGLRDVTAADVRALREERST